MHDLHALHDLDLHVQAEEGLTKAGLQPEQARCAAVRLLRDGGGAVEFSRFVAALVPSCRDLLSAKLLRSSFDRLDENGDGFVSRAELQRLLERAGSKLAQAQRPGGVRRFRRGVDFSPDLDFSRVLGGCS